MLRSVYAINAGRNNGNTAKFLKKALEGAAAAGAKTELINLTDIPYNGCVGCLTCKKRTLSGRPKKCYHNDPLTPILEKVAKADGLIIGSPVYFWRLSANFRCFAERFLYPRFSYETGKITIPSPIKTGLIFTMGGDKDYCTKMDVNPDLINYRNYFSSIGPVKDLWVQFTPHVKDYRKWEFGPLFKNRDPPYEEEMKTAFEIGKFVAIK